MRLLARRSLAVSCVVLLVAVPAQAAFFGAIYTTTRDGTAVNENQYNARGDVYLGGGPQNEHANGLPDGTYYFQVTTTDGATVLSSDAAECRQLLVVNERIAGATGPCPHANGDVNGANGVTPVQLAPFALHPAACDGAAAAEYKVFLIAKTSTTVIDPLDSRVILFEHNDAKSDNFKVRESAGELAITCPDAATAECAGGAGSASFGEPTVTTACGEDYTVDSDLAASYPYTCGGSSHAVTFTATSADDSASCETSVNVVDTQGPIVACADVTVTADASCVGHAGAPGAGDACDGAVAATCDSTSFAGTGTHTRTCSASDCAGNSGSCDSVVTVVDNTAPVASCPAPQTLECAGPCATAATVTASASDNCGASIACSPGSGNYCLGTTTNTCVAVDGAGNSDDCTTTVSVVDTLAPALTCTPDVTVRTSDNAGNACVAALAVSADASDVCEGGSAGYCDPGLLEAFLPGTSSSVCSAADSSGNSSSCETSLTLIDDTAPSIACAAPQTLVADASCRATASFSATAVDNCYGPVDAACTPGSVTFTAPGSASSTCSASDPSGNSASCTTSATMIDNTPPTVSCGAAITSIWPPNHKKSFDIGLSITVSDNCSSNVVKTVTSVTSDEPTATGSGDGGPQFWPDAWINGTSVVLRAERSGNKDGRVYRIGVQAVDAAGNVGTGSCAVRVDHSMAQPAVDSGQLYDATKRN